jgi:putative transcriptional regulator
MELQRNLLIAPPAIKDSFWTKTVILITEHHADGSLGLVVNKRSEMTVNDFCRQLGFDADLEGYVYVGGPVNRQSLSVLHSSEWSSSNTLRLDSKFSISSDHEILPRLVAGDTPKHWRIMLGLCTWTAGQLDGELKGEAPWPRETAWCTATSDLGILFETDQSEQWCLALDRSGSEFAHNILL